MKNEKTQYATRESVQKLLSEIEISSISTAESADRLLQDEEYIDLERLDLGAQRAVGTAPVMGHVLPKKAVRPETWSKILAQLQGPGAAKTGTAASA